MNDALWNALTAEDKEKIDFWISEYGGIDAHCLYNHAPLFDILSAWNISKRNLWEMFNHEFILTRPVEIKAIEDDLMKEITDVRNSSTWVSDINEFIHAYGWSYTQYTYVNENDKVTNRRDAFEYLSELMWNTSLLANTYNGPTFSLLTPDRKVVKIQSGCKVSKALQTIQKKFNVGDAEDFEAFRIKHSQVLNTKTLKGNLHLSIHPLDFITMSDNGCGWESCMNWINNGDYRMGTIEMMNSSMVVCAYLDSKEPYYLDESRTMEWSNKKWRELFIVDKSLLLGIKGYPYINRELESICLDWIKELIEAHPELDYGPYMNRTLPLHNDCDNSFMTEDSDEVRNVRLWIDCNYMYNDIYDEHFGYLNPNVGHQLNLNYSGESTCLDCGEDSWGKQNSDYDACNLICCDCNEMIRCDYCGDWHYVDDCWNIDGNYICEYCYNEYCRECEDCGQLHTENNSYRVYLMSEGKYSYHDYHAVTYLCDECFNQRRKEWHIHYEKLDRWNGEWVVDLEAFSWDNDTIEKIANIFREPEEYIRELMEDSKHYWEQAAIDEDVATDLETSRENETKSIKLVYDDFLLTDGCYSPVKFDEIIIDTVPWRNAAEEMADQLACYRAIQQVYVS